MSVLRCDGGGELRFRAYQRRRRSGERDAPTLSSSSSSEGSSGRQDVEVTFGGGVSVDVDLRSAIRLIEIADAMTGKGPADVDGDDGAVDDFVDARWEDGDDDIGGASRKNEERERNVRCNGDDVPGTTTVPEYVLADEFNREAYDRIMRQYTEARHLARTRELRGGLLIPSFDDMRDGGGDDDCNFDRNGEGISFDAFFDANDHSVGYYCSMIDGGEGGVAAGGLGGGRRRGRGGDGRRVFMKQTKIELGLPEFTVNVRVKSFTTDDHDDANRTMPGSDWNTSRPEHILLSIGDMRVIVFRSNGESKLNCCMSHFDVECQSMDGQTEPVFRFFDESDDCGSRGVGGLLVSSPPCLSLMAEFSDVADKVRDNACCRVDVTIQPFEITYQERALRRLSEVLAQLPHRSDFTDLEGDVEGGHRGKLRDVQLHVSCGSIVLVVPCQRDPEHKPKNATSCPLFQRHGYRDHGSGGRKFFCLGLELDNVTFELSHKGIVDDNTNLTSKESKAAMSCSHMILFAGGIEIERRRRNIKLASLIPRRADIVVFTGDEVNESSISISYSNETQNSRLNSSFPIILPLSSTKARQERDESDDDEVDDFNDDVVNGARGIQSSDPQYVLSSEAAEAEGALSINVPNIFFDSTPCERRELTIALSSFFSKSSDDDKSEVSDAKGQYSRHNCWLGLAVNVGQISVVLHGSRPSEANSYSLIMDRLQVHTLIGSSGVRNVRFLSHDVTLYELSDFFPSQDVHHRIDFPTSCHEKCKRVRQRFSKSPSSLARAIVFRQKICQSLSPETPALLVDLLLRGDDECGEMSIHVNIYDMTYRYITKSLWLQNIFTLINGESKVTASDKDNVGREDYVSADSRPSMIDLFVNLSDCNVDYTTPLSFINPSRIILRMGEIRFSSNIVMPSAMIQAYKFSLSDLRLHICNYRHCYNEENARLSRAHRHFKKEDLCVPENAKCLSDRNIVGLDDGLCRMDFVNVVVLDKVDATISKLDNDSRRKDPSTTVVLVLGKLSVYACHDSFFCLIQTYNEWFIKATALSAEELAKLKESSETQTEVSFVLNEFLLPLEQQASSDSQSKNEIISTTETVALPNNINCSAVSRTIDIESPSPIDEQQCYDDIELLDLTKTLLFQNYYTIDTSRQALNQSQELDHLMMVTRKEEIDVQTPNNDDWATIEHGFMHHSSLPRERHESAEWIICNSHPTASSNCNSAPISTRSSAVKIFPQHVPVKPILDPFSGGSQVDTAKLTGTEVAPKIEMRIIVKDGSIAFRFFDGFDWVNDAPQFHQREDKPKDRKKVLLSSLVEGGSSSTFDAVPLPEERNKILQRDLAQHKLRRNAHKYFQISLSGLKIKNDSFSECKEHRLASCLDLSVSDFFVAETISMGDPLKMIGEWINETEHPRDDSDGMIMLKMITKHPTLRLSSDGKLMSDESRGTLELLPLRCYLNQNSLLFIRNFFRGPSEAEGEDNQINAVEDGVVSDDGMIDIFFESFKVRPLKLKVDYQPETMDIDSFREGHYIELLNLCPLEEMILTLQSAEMQDLTGWGPVFSELASRWLEDICSTQAHKFFTRASPFQPFCNLGDPLADLVMVLVIPEGNITDYFRGVVGGTTNFAGKVALEALSTAAKLTRFAANQLNSKALASAPRRPRRTPRHAGEASSHAYESVARGLREANYNIVTVPLREYYNSGAGGAARSVCRGLPVGVLCPIAGASEALSYTLLGLRNQLRPDLRREEEESLRGLNYD
ncbi:hypothetical protein ACHAXA_008584 [Cyclostephanos tholiformis]|uniref:Autophagy-related protein 2 n=1 Tax=Cyclostephanos tholiformis TaxID=382380 RepID=A0ABD3SPS9_9STRA